MVIGIPDKYKKCIKSDRTFKKILLKKEKLEKLSEKFKLLAHPTRLQILKLLSRKEQCVCVLVQLLKKRQANISQHLAKLKAAGIIKSREVGKWVFYSIKDKEVKDIIKKIVNL